MSPLAATLLASMVLGLGLAALGVAALLPSPVRAWARAALVFAVVLSPVLVLAGLLVAFAPKLEPGTWLLFLPLTFVYLASLDLRYGVSARLSRGIGPDAVVTRHVRSDDDGEDVP